MYIVNWNVLITAICHIIMEATDNDDMRNQNHVIINRKSFACENRKVKRYKMTETLYYYFYDTVMVIWFDVEHPAKMHASLCLLSIDSWFCKDQVGCWMMMMNEEQTFEEKRPTRKTTDKSVWLVDKVVEQWLGRNFETNKPVWRTQMMRWRLWTWTPPPTPHTHVGPIRRHKSTLNIAPRSSLNWHLPVSVFNGLMTQPKCA